MVEELSSPQRQPHSQITNGWSKLTELAVVPVEVEEKITIVKVAIKSHGIEALRCMFLLMWRVGSRRLPKLQNTTMNRSSSPQVTYWHSDNKYSRVWWVFYPSFINNPYPSFLKVSHFFASPVPSSTPLFSQLLPTDAFTPFRSDAKFPTQLITENHPFSGPATEIKSLFDRILATEGTFSQDAPSCRLSTRPSFSTSSIGLFQS